MSTSTTIVVAVLVVIVAVGTVLIVRRRRYIGSLRNRGWTFESAPELDSVLDHAAPPFGLGFTRSVDESISGTTAAGVGFHVFEYKSGDGGPAFDGRVASLRLPLALPDLFVSSGSGLGVDLPRIAVDPAWQVQTSYPELAAAFFTDRVRAAITAYGQQTGAVNLSLDGDHLVALEAPKDPDELQTFLEAVAAIATAADWQTLRPLAIAPHQVRFSFYGRPDWEFVGSDDSLIDRYGLTTVGSHHRTELLVRSPNDGLPLEAFVHRWQTSRTVVSTDSQGRTTTRTVHDQHEETITAVWLPFSVPLLSLNGGWGGQRVRFESEDFNDSYAVRTDNPKFASDVLHPRTMEYLMSVEAPTVRMQGQLMSFDNSVHDTRLIAACADFAHEFWARVPSFVWSDLGVDPPPFRTFLPAE